MLPLSIKTKFYNCFKHTFLPMIPPKSIPQIADEFGMPHKTLRNHIKRDTFLYEHIKKGWQMPLQQKWIYTRFGYPPGVNKSDYSDVD